MIGGNQVMTAVEQNTLKRRGVGMKAFDPERACPGFTLFAPLFVESRTVYLIDLQGKVVHTWKMPYSPGLSGYLTERGTLYYNGRYPEDNFLSRFPFKGGVALKRIGAARCSGKYVIRANTTTVFCCAMATCCLIAWARYPTKLLSVSKEGWTKPRCDRANIFPSRRPRPARCILLTSPS